MTAIRVEYVLEHREVDDAVEVGVGKRQWLGVQVDDAGIESPLSCARSTPSATISTPTSCR